MSETIDRGLPNPARVHEHADIVGSDEPDRGEGVLGWSQFPQRTVGSVREKKDVDDVEVNKGASAEAALKA